MKSIKQIILDFAPALPYHTTTPPAGRRRKRRDRWPPFDRQPRLIIINNIGEGWLSFTNAYYPDHHPFLYHHAFRRGCLWALRAALLPFYISYVDHNSFIVFPRYC